MADGGLEMEKDTDRAQTLQNERPPQHQARQPGRETQMDPEPLVMREQYRGSGKLNGKVALITGGDSGIGRSVAVHFAREGADVAIIYLEESADAQETRRMVRDEGRRCLLLEGNCRSANFCRTAVAEVVSVLGKLNILVNNAAEQHVRQNLEDIDDEQLRATFETNIFPYFYITKAALEHLQQGDAIVNTGSITSFHGSAILMDYAATKGAIQAFTFSLAQSLAERGIRVNGVAPGPIWTPLIPATFPPENVETFGQNTLMKRAGQPAEVAPAYVFLASEDASFITGQFIHINGGSFIAP